MKLRHLLLLSPVVALLHIPTKEIAPGVAMPSIAIGTGGHATAQHGAVRGMIKDWLQLGGRAIDTAWMYMDQEDVAQGIADSQVPRSELFVTTKLLMCGGETATRDFINADLNKLNTTYIDLLLLHYPVGYDCAGTWATLESYRAIGVLRAIGVSNFRRGDLEQLMQTAKVRPAVNQVQINLWYHNDGTAEYCHENNITLQAYSPLGWTGTRPGVSNTNKTLRDPTVVSIANQQGVTPAQVVLRWIVQQEHPLIVQTSSVPHMHEDSDIFHFELTPQQMTALSGLMDGRTTTAREEVIAILGQSGGDVQACTEVASYTKNLFRLALLPQSIPEAVRGGIAEIAWLAGRKQTMEEYEAVPNSDCNTRMRDVSVLATQLTAARAQLLAGRDIHPFSGWKFMQGSGINASVPTVLDTLAAMQAAGVTKAFVIDQDFLAYDNEWEGLTYRQIRHYLKANPQWKVSFIGLNGFTEQPGFIELLSSKLLHQINTAFPQVLPQDLCVVLPSQGVPISSETSPGCGVARIRAAMEKLQSQLPAYNLTLVFTNHGEGHGGPWSAPSDKLEVPRIASEFPCKHVLTTPILQWPQTDYTVYVFQGNGTIDEPGYEHTFRAAGKGYRHMPAWDLAEEHWDARPPRAGPIALSAIDTALPDFTARIVADVLAGRSVGYDLTLIDQLR